MVLRKTCCCVVIVVVLVVLDISLFSKSVFDRFVYRFVWWNYIFKSLRNWISLTKYIFIVRSVGFVGFVERKCMYRIYKYKNQSSDCNILLYLASTGLYAGKIFVPCYKIQFARLKYKWYRICSKLIRFCQACMANESFL